MRDLRGRAAAAVFASRRAAGRHRRYCDVSGHACSGGDDLQDLSHDRARQAACSETAEKPSSGCVFAMRVDAPGCALRSASGIVRGSYIPARALQFPRAPAESSAQILESRLVCSRPARQAKGRPLKPLRRRATCAACLPALARTGTNAHSCSGIRRRPIQRRNNGLLFGSTATKASFSSSVKRCRPPSIGLFPMPNSGACTAA